MCHFLSLVTLELVVRPFFIPGPLPEVNRLVYLGIIPSQDLAMAAAHRSLPVRQVFPPSQNVTIAGASITGVNFAASNTVNIFQIQPLFGPETFTDPVLTNNPDGITNFPCRLFKIVADNSAGIQTLFVKAYNIGTPIVGVTPPQIVLRVPTGAVITQEFHTGNYPGTVFSALSICPQQPAV